MNAGNVWLLWRERPTTEGAYVGDCGVLVGVFGDLETARERAEMVRRQGAKGSVQITRERVMVDG